MNNFFGAVVILLSTIHASAQYCINEGELVYSDRGQLSLTGTFNKCLTNLADPFLMPTYSTGEILNVTSYILLNNLISIDELTSTATIDFFYRLYWTDPRLSMPAMWETLNNSKISSYGLDITQALNSQNPNGTTVSQIWLPDLFFPDAIAIDTHESEKLIRIYPGGALFWSRHITVSLLESSFSYQTYPLDTQYINLRYISYGFDVNWMEQYLHNPPLSYFLNAEGSPCFEQNPLWSYNGYTMTVFPQEYSGVVKSEVLFQLSITRQASGIILRLAAPMFLLVILAGLTFWAAAEERFDSTSTFLLAISALYIVVFQNIPMVGYLTTFDVYSTFMFAILFLCCVIHQFVSRLNSHSEPKPIRTLTVRVCECLGRLGIVPTVIFIYFHDFAGNYTSGSIGVAIIVGALFAAVVLLREAPSVRKECINFFNDVVVRADSLQATRTEILLLNVVKYGKLSTTLSHHHKAKAHNEKIQATDSGCIEMHENPMPHAHSSLSSGEFPPSNIVPALPARRHGSTEADSDDES